jgi:hypothetical protein
MSDADDDALYLAALEQFEQAQEQRYSWIAAFPQLHQLP